MVQLSTPGVYIEEFAPGAPISAVGTSTAAFIGVALRGPIETPTLIQSWDAFVETFGGIITDGFTGHLAGAVYGFFLNGGTTCYVVRAGTGTMATADLDGRNTTNDPPIIATASTEGPGGNAVSVEVVESSRLASALAGVGSAATGLSPARLSTTVTSVEADRRSVVVADNTGFAPGDRVLLDDGGGATEVVIVDATSATTGISFVAPIPGVTAFTGGTVRSADLVPGQRAFRVTVPAGLNLRQALPAGSSIAIDDGTNREVHTVEASAGDQLTLTAGLANGFALDDPADLPGVSSLEFDLIVNDTATGGTESFAELSMNARHPGYWASAVDSAHIALSPPDAPPAPMPADPRPEAGVYNLAGGTADDRAAAWTDLTATDPASYLALLEPVDEVAIVAIPGAVTALAQQAVRDHCEKMWDRFGVLDSEPGAEPGNGIRDQHANVTSERGFVALYYPWISVVNPENGQTELWPPSGHLAGIYARVDAQRGVHKAPANTNIRGALGLERNLTDEQQGPLNLMGINVLRVFPGQAQPLVWGARTTATDANWTYINIRRLFLFLEESIEEGIRWAVFEPHDLALWEKLKRTIGEFLTRVWRDGALFGSTPDEAFYVRIDANNNPESSRAIGRLNIEIGVAPTYPAEFIVVRIGIWRDGSEISDG